MAGGEKCFPSIIYIPEIFSTIDKTIFTDSGVKNKLERTLFFSLGVWEQKSEAVTSPHSVLTSVDLKPREEYRRLPIWRPREPGQANLGLQR